MRKTVGILGVIVGLGLVVGLVAPKFVGAKAEAQLKEYVKNSQGAMGFTFELKDYKRGWFHSTATLVMTDPKAKTQAFQVVIKHGPLIFKGMMPHFAWGSANFEPEILPELQANIDKYFANSSTKPHFDGSLLISSSTQFNLNYAIPAGNYKDTITSPAMTYDWKALNADIGFKLRSNKLDKIVSKIAFDGMGIVAGPQTIKIDPMTFDLNAYHYKPDSWIWLGESTLKTGDISVTDPLQGSYHFSGFMMQSKASLSDKQISVSQELGIKTFKMNNLKGGPIDFKLSINKLDSDAWESLLTAAQNQAATDEEKQAAVMPLIKGGVEVSLDSNVQIDNKTFTATGKFVLPPYPELKDLASQSPDLLKKLSLDFSMKAPVSLVKTVMIGGLKQKMAGKLESQVGTEWSEGAKTGDGSEAPEAKSPVTAESSEQIKAQVDTQLDELVKNNTLVQKGDEYMLHLTLKEGIVYLNDERLKDLTAMQNQGAFNWFPGMKQQVARK